MDIDNTFSFSQAASHPQNAIALIYDLEGFSRFFNQPDVQHYVPAFLNHVSRALSCCLFGGKWWDGEDVDALDLRVAHEKFMGDGALYVLLPPSGDADFSPGTLRALCNRLWNIKNDFDEIIARALEHDVPVFEVPQKIRFGISRGSVYELKRTDGSVPEFVGFCINQASRLQSYCPDLGFLASARLMVPVNELTSNGYRKVVAKKIKGFPEEVVIVDSEEYEGLPDPLKAELFHELKTPKLGPNPGQSPL